jgi:NAD(P)-dependent dehydrogenase (short-subunit alcohol dehydrogenase family)
VNVPSPSEQPPPVRGRLDGAVILLGGAAGGIGRASCRRLTDEGARLIAADRDADALADATAGLDAITVAVDLTDAERVDALLGEAIARAGRLDGVFATAGASGRRYGDGPVDECTIEGWRWTIDVNLTSAFLICRAALPSLRQGGRGSIVLLGSVLGVAGGGPAFATHAYAAAKAGLGGLVRGMASTYAADGIRANLLAPGLVDTPMSRRAKGDPEVMADVAARQPLGGMAEPEDVAAAAAFLLSADSARITGATLPIEGGWLIR